MPRVPRVLVTPKTGQSLEKGRDVLLENTINGYNNIMPPKGMCFTCSNDELALVLDYILENSAE